ncbi:hypothetical protein MAR_009046 [Mya arenaria]|uniref:Uncharacterized protein n=1 Tax=Mya arenaria TaxID=6604 RepID=A0ABY7DXP4_MYAAR|nr:hypothetical protein MAR_009046 [Mya arenaria]
MRWTVASYALPESAIIEISVGGIILLISVAICIWVLVEKNKTKPRRMIRLRQNANIAAVAVPSAPGYHPPQNDISQYPPPPTYNQVFSQYPRDTSSRLHTVRQSATPRPTVRQQPGIARLHTHHRQRLTLYRQSISVVKLIAFQSMS